MKGRNAILVVLGVVIVASLYLARRQPAPPESTPPTASEPASTAPAATPAAESARVPPYHTSAAEAEPLPKTLPPERFSIPVVARAYTVAQRIPEVLAQQPCYCWCDKFGHRSLVDCFASDHGAG